MPLYVVDHRGGAPMVSFERSPHIALETDATSSAELPEAIHAAWDSIAFRRLDSLQTNRIPKGADAVVTWLAGDQLLQGSAASIGRELHSPGRRCFVPVHYPCMTELDLLAIEPRWLSGGRMSDFWSAAARIARPSSISVPYLSALKAINQPWAKMVQAFFAETASAGAGIESLARLAQDASAPSQVTALALRNLVVLLMKNGDMAKAEQVLEGAMDTFPDYAELFYVSGLLCVRQNKPSKALGYLERARASNHEYVGSGGENSYRAAWLLGRIAAQAGNQKAALEGFHAGIVNQPVFGPSAEDLLQLRLPPALVEIIQYDITRLVRREPQYLDAAFDFLLLHRAFPAARRITKTIPLGEEEKDRLLRKLASAEAPFSPKLRSEGKSGVLLCGAFFEHSSLARINREIATALLRCPKLDVALEPNGYSPLPAQRVPNGMACAEALSRRPKHLDLTIRHHWPPDFQRPPRGKLAVIVPWEFGAVPRIWVREIERNVDELWVPSDFVRGVFTRAGVSEHRVQVIPNGFDAKLLTPDGPSARPTGCRRFVFLFVGGAIARKGIDLLLQAYAQAFESGDDVTLAVSTGANPAYAHNSLDGLLAKFMRDVRLPHLAFLSKQFEDTDLAALYRGCDAFVLPYRGEGFGMPIAEAMACGKPVITTAAGPAAEFCPPDCGYFIPAIESPVHNAPPPFGEFVGEWNWFEPDVASLARTMRHVYEHPEEAAARGRNAARAIRRKHTWEQITPIYVERINQLTRRDTTSDFETTRDMDEEGACQESLCP